MKKLFLICFAIFIVLVTIGLPVVASTGGGYAGLEFYGSSLISRVELDKILRLREGATLDNAEKALERLKIVFEKKSLKANVEIVPDGATYYISVDVLDTGYNNTTANRRLQDPRHITIPNEKPFALLEELKTRMEKLAEEGRPTAETYENGMRGFSDVACMRNAEKIATELGGQQAYLFKILATDPNGERRSQAAELLNWIPDPVDNSLALLPALDDCDLRVRMAAAKYIWARTNLFPDSFPFDSLLEGLSRQLARPSHHDRVRAMAALLALAKRDSDSIGGIKTFDETKCKEIAANSIIPSVQSLAGQLVGVCANPPANKKMLQEKERESY